MNARSICAIAASFISFLACGQSVAGELDGCWRQTKLTLYFKSGGQQEMPRNCLQEFFGDRSLINCGDQTVAEIALSNQRLGHFTYQTVAEHKPGSNPVPIQEAASNASVSQDNGEMIYILHTPPEDRRSKVQSAEFRLAPANPRNCAKVMSAANSVRTAASRASPPPANRETYANGVGNGAPLQDVTIVKQMACSGNKFAGLIVSANNNSIFEDNVRTKAVLDGLMTNLRRQSCGQYVVILAGASPPTVSSMLGEGKWRCEDDNLFSLGGYSVNGAVECFDKANIPNAYRYIGANFNGPADVYRNTITIAKAEAQETLAEQQAVDRSRATKENRINQMVTAAVGPNPAAGEKGRAIQIAIREVIREKCEAPTECKSFAYEAVAVPVSRADDANGFAARWQVRMQFLAKPDFSNWGEVVGCGVVIKRKNSELFYKSGFYGFGQSCTFQ